MARNKKVEILSNDKEVLHPMTDGDCVIFEDGQTLTQKLSEDDSVKYTPEIVNSSPMFKVGEGNTVDYSDNVLDGAYERATLQGQTYTNYIQESSADEVTLPTPFTEYERTQHNTLTSDEEGVLGINLVGQSYVNALQHDSEEEYVVLGESLEFQEKKVEYTNEGQIKSAMLKGQTLINIFKSFANYSYSASEIGVKWLIGGAAPLTETLNNDELTMTITGVGSKVVRIDNTSMLKPNTKYMVKINYTTSFESGINFGYVNNSTIYTQIASMKSNEYAIFTTPTDLSTWVGLWFGVLSDLQAGDVIKISKPVLFEYQEGMENWDIPYFEGMQSVTVSTRLENKLGTCTVGSIAQYAKNGKTFTTTDGSARQCTLYSTSQASTNPANLKPNTEYIIGFQVSNLVLDGLSSVDLTFSSGTVDSGNCLFTSVTGGDSRVAITSNGTYRIRRKTTDLITSSLATIKGFSGQWEESGSSLRSLTISNIMYVEYQNGMENWNLPYFEDYQVMKPIQVESVNKNLFDKDNFVLNKGLAWADGSVVTINNQGQQVSESYVPINYNSTYIMTGLQNGLVVCVYDHNKNVIGFLNNDGRTMANLGSVAGTAITSFSLSNYPHSKYVRFCVRGDGSQNTQDISNVQIEESDTATEYVPHQSKTTYSWDEVILRKVGDVEDTLDLTTGEWVQRIGEITLDGSSDEVWQKIDLEMWGTTNGVQDSFGYIYYFQHNYKTADYIAFHEQESNLYTLCDKLPVCSRKDSVLSSKTNVCTTGGASPSTIQNNTMNTYIGIKLDTTKATTVDEFKTWLKQNPLKVHVVMNKPIVHKVNLSRPNLQVYDDITHVHTKCLDGTLIPNIYLPSDISYPAILEPGKKYNVCVNHTEVSADNPLKVNVGGTEITMTDSRMTLTTPTTLANSNVSFTGKGNKIKESMLIKNSSLLTRDLPHFNGIGSVQLGKTIENLCSSDTIAVGGGTGTIVSSNDYVDVTMTKAGSRVFLFELLKVLEDGKKYFIYAPNTYPTTSQCYASFRGKIQGSLSYTNDVSTYGHEKYWILTVNHKTDSPYSHLCLGQHGNIRVNTNFRLQRPIICEYEQGMENWDWESIGYFTGTKNIGNEFMRIGNKNLFDGINRKYYINVETYLMGLANNNNGGVVDVSNVDNVVVSSTSIQTRFRIGCTNKLPSENGEAVAVYNGVNLDSNSSAKASIDCSNYKYLIVNAVDLSMVQVEKSSTATTYTAHKHNGLYITKDQPIELTWEQGRINPSGIGDSYANAINNAVSYGIRTKGLLNLKPNTTYRISLGDKASFKYHVAVFDNWDNALTSSSLAGIGGDWVSSRDTIFTTTKDVHKIGINVQKQDASSITPPESVHVQVRLEEVTDVVLRSCSGKYDELDLTRGTYTQNVGVVYVDGVNQHSNYITVVGDSYQPTDTTLKTFDIRCDGAVVDSICLSNRFPMRESMTSTAINFESVRIHSTNTSCRLTIKKEKASTLEEFKLWLQDNPLEIIYALTTPIVHKVHIGNKNEANTEVTKPNGVFTLPTSYAEQTHIDLTNNGIIPKVQSRDYIAYPVLPMVGRTYTLQHNLTGGVSNLTVDLLGRTQSASYQNHKSLVYTPETMGAILHNELRISGKGKIGGVMYIDGGYMDRDIPYIEGMKNAVNPIVKNVGKNLVQKIDNIWYFYDNIINQGGASHNCGIAPVKPYAQYIINKNSILCFYDENGKCTNSPFQYFNANSPRTAPSGSKYMLVRHNGGDNATYLDGLQVVEYAQEFDNQEYKENICYVDCGEIKLTPDMFEQGSITVQVVNIGKPYTVGLNTDKGRIRTKKPINIEPNEQYVIIGNTDKYGYSLHFLDKDENFIGVKAPYELSWGGHKPFTVASDSPKALVFIKRMDNGTITPNDVDAFNFQLVKVSEIKQLRSLPHGVQDEIDLETGKYIQRVGEITFNGTENWKVGYASWDNKRTYYNDGFVDIKTWKGDNGSGQAYYDAVRCPQLHRSYMGRLASALIDGVCSYYYSGYQRIFISKQDCATVDELKLWLQENPITIQYELPEPIVKDIVIHNYPHSYEDGHVIIENGDPNTPIPAQLTYRAVTNRSGQIQQHTEQVEKQEREINELETLILANIHLSQTR